MNANFYFETSKALGKGLATYIPGVRWLFSKRKTGGTISARYAYSVWLRYLVMLYENGRDTNPEVVAELGPGDSIGIGLCALLTGARKYWGFDVVSYIKNERNLKILESLKELLSEKAKIPDAGEFSEIKPALGSYEFPKHILTDERLASSLRPERIGNIKSILKNSAKIREGNEIQIGYFAPWYEENNLIENSVDFIFSQAVLEHVDDLEKTYSALRRWLKPTGVMSHQIDFRSHQITTEWNGHWVYDEWFWELIRGRRPYYLNRFPCSVHLDYLHKYGFKTIFEMRHRQDSNLQKRDIARQFDYFTEEDLTSAGIFLQAVKV